MRTENLPVKIDCHALRNLKGTVEASSKEHIGYILVPVKNIPIVPLDKALKMKPRWVKIIGLSKEWRPHRPELLMHIMITSKDFLSCTKNDILESQGIVSNDSFIMEENPIPCMLTSQRGLFIRLLQEEGLLQIGNIDTCCDVFTVQLIIKNARYLENLIPDDEDAESELYINYVLLGNPHTRALNKKFNRCHQIQEKISINFRTTLAALAEYFDKIFFVPLEVMSGSRVLGATEIKLGPVVKIHELQMFLEKNPSHLFEIDAIANVKTLKEIPSNVNKPILEYKLAIQYVATKKLHQTECLEIYQRNQEVDIQGGGDGCSEEKPAPSVQSPRRKALSDILEVRSDGSKKSSKGKAKEKPADKADIALLLKEHQEGEVSELPRIFSYNLQLSSIKFNKKPEKGTWQLSFFHDRADIQRTIINKEINDENISTDNTIEFNDLELKLVFTSCIADIMSLVKSSEICTFCVKGPRKMHAKAQLDCNSLLVGNKEKIGGKIFLQDQVENVTGIANIFVYLEDVGVNFNTQVKTAPDDPQNVTRTIEEEKVLLMDEGYSYKVIEELEDWKIQQQDAFIGELKKQETSYLNLLKDSWTQKQSVFEQDLVIRSDQLSSLVKSLQDAQSKLKERDNRASKEQHDFMKLKTELERSFNDQLMITRERARRLEDDLLHEIKLKEIRFDDIQRCNEHSKAENCELRQQNERLQAKLRELQVTSIPKADLERVIQEMVSCVQ